MRDDEVIFKLVARNPRYEVSSKGGFFRVGKDGGRRELSPELDDKGRPRVWLWHGRGREPERVRLARLVAEAFHGPSPPGRPLALHKDDDVSNSAASNVYWGDHGQNLADAYRNGRRRYRYTEEQVFWARKLASIGLTPSEIAGEVQIPADYVRAIVAGRARRPRPNAPSW